MKKINKLFLFLLMLAALCFVTACKKDPTVDPVDPNGGGGTTEEETRYTVSFIDCNNLVKRMNVKAGTSLGENYAPKLTLSPYGELNAYWDVTFPVEVNSDLVIYAVREFIDFVDTPNEEFDELLEDLFYDELGTEPLSIVFNLYHPENFYKEGVFDFNECYFDGYDFSEEGDAEYYAAIKERLEQLKSYADNTLTHDQYLAKIVLIDSYEKALAFEDYYYYGTSLGSYLGYQAQLPSTLAEYRFDNKKCIEDYFSYLEYTQSIFEGIVGFEKDKAQEGMPLTDVIINRVIEQCDEFINADSEHPCFLIPVFANKVDKLDFLTADEKEAYKKRNEELVTGKFVQAYVYLRGELEGMLGMENEVVLESGEKYYGTFAQMENGKDYYEAKVHSALGISESVDDLYKYLTKLLGTNMGVYRTYSDTINQMNQKNVMMENGLGLNALIPFFMEKIQGSFPALDVTLDWKISEVDESLRENSSPAYYFISPIDDNLTESIYVNPENEDLKFPSTYMYTTIAHEGYPGHLYQNVFMKNLDSLYDVQKLISYTSYAEGWAVYVENYVYQFVSDIKNISDIMLAYESLSYLIIGLCDIKANYYGESPAQIYSFLSNYFNMDEEEALDIYYDVTEIPTNYLMYFHSAFRLIDARNHFKELMGDDYSDLLFHEVVLSCGSVSFEVLNYRLNEYAYNYCTAKRAK